MYLGIKLQPDGCGKIGRKTNGQQNQYKIQWKKQTNKNFKRYSLGFYTFFDVYVYSIGMGIIIVWDRFSCGQHNDTAGNIATWQLQGRSWALVTAFPDFYRFYGFLLPPKNIPDFELPMLNCCKGKLCVYTVLCHGL